MGRFEMGFYFLANCLIGQCPNCPTKWCNMGVDTDWNHLPLDKKWCTGEWLFVCASISNPAPLRPVVLVHAVVMVTVDTWSSAKVVVHIGNTCKIEMHMGWVTVCWQSDWSWKLEVVFRVMALFAYVWWGIESLWHEPCYLLLKCENILSFMQW